MDWRTVVYGVMVLVAVTLMAGVIEERFDHREWLAAPPFLRWAANAAIAAATILAVPLLFYAVYVAWQVAAAVALAAGAFWFLLLGVARLLELLGVGDGRPSEISDGPGS